jgi:hypothetical protein
LKTTHKILLFLSILFILSGCSSFSRNSNQSSSPISTTAPTAISATEVVTPTAVSVPPSPTPAPVLPTADTSSLQSMVLGQLAPGVYEGFQILPLATFPGQPSLWAIYSVGLRNFEASGSPSHFVAIFTHDAAGSWQELSKINLETNSDTPSPDYLDNGGVKQVNIEPTRVWLSVEGGIGAHGGVFQLLSFDGKQLKIEVTGANDSPGAGSIQDLNNDGLMDVILNISDNYVFCYACSVRKYAYEVYRWDSASAGTVKVELTPLTSDQPKNVPNPANLAVSLAKAGLWKDALVQAKVAMKAALLDNTSNLNTVTWNQALIQLHADALGNAVSEGPYPLLANVFYGDYAAAVDLFRGYTPDQIFSLQSPLITGTPAEGNESSLSSYLLDSANLAISQEANLSPAYFIRAWAEYLKDSTDPNVRADVEMALSLSPDDPLYKASVELLK